MRGEKDRWEKSQQEAHRAQEDAKKAEMDRYYFQIHPLTNLQRILR